jgi:hypothetical protein
LNSIASGDWSDAGQVGAWSWVGCMQVENGPACAHWAAPARCGVGFGSGAEMGCGCGFDPKPMFGFIFSFFFSISNFYIQTKMISNTILNAISTHKILMELFSA